ncbi:collagen-like triple helix repeat-containing protein [Clostridium paraputrificum]|uniref:collagen-like triple helix repeat-containing protein n=1 Tax=Clostridium paraputrificum TaxID=29363 RepID=UPI001B3C6F20|nr:collagen-like protein [Clostridium paraputrificum]
MENLRKFRVQFLSSDNEAEDVDILTSASCINLTNGQTLQQFIDGGNMDGTVWIVGSVAPTNQGKEGDFYLNRTTFELYRKVSGVWQTMGSIKGAKGDTGSTGATGAPGTPGKDGTPGTKGADGATWLFGTAVPNTEGKKGDFYLKTDTYDIYSKATGSWVKTGNIKGAKGDKGNPGEKGEPGDGIRVGTSYEESTPTKIFFKLVEG